MASPLKPLPRRLYELLEEQQEPFLLDVHHLESGCCGGTFRFLRQRRPRAGILRCFLGAKVGFWKAIRRALNRERCKLSGCYAAVRSEASFSGFHRLSVSSSSAAEVDPSGDTGWKGIEHSPVSVLELHSDEGSSSDHNHSMEEENLSTCKCIAPAKCEPRQLLLDFLKEMEVNDMEACDDLLGRKVGGDIIMQEMFPWEQQKQKQRGDHVASFTRLLSLDLSSREWTQLETERREIGMQIGGIILEEMSEECVFDMLNLHWMSHESS